MRSLVPICMLAWPLAGCATDHAGPGADAGAADASPDVFLQPPPAGAGFQIELSPFTVAAQQEVSREILASRVGTVIDVIVDEVDEDGALGRSKWDAPEIDGSVFLNGETGVNTGDIVQARVDTADDYDLWATVVSKS